MAYDLPNDVIYPRLINGPDGYEYLFRLEGMFWNNLDWIIGESTWEEANLIRQAWMVAKQMENDGTMTHPGDFKAEFVEAFKAVIATVRQHVINDHAGVVNDNIEGEQGAWTRTRMA